MKISLLPQYSVIFRRQLRRKLASRRVPCPLCGSPVYSEVCKSPNVHMAVFREVFAENVVRCDSCDFVFTNPRPSSRALERYYTRDYALEGLDVPKSIDEFLGDSHKEIWFSKDRDLQLILRQETSGRLLDIGCASGTLLWLAKQKGFSVQGVEVARHSAEFVRNVLGIEVFCGQLQDARFPDKSFDVITMFHSLEHVPNPRSAVREVRRILASSGVFIIVVPNYAGWSSEKHGADWIWLQPQNHYSHFTPQSLRNLLAREGFSSQLYSEEGRYGEAELTSLYSESEVSNMYASLKGSELIAAATHSAP
jgi:2-polyprenyl-3-methyl-5-hydroxy-6-metoxy-1,4-benzoquinol methylase